MHICSCRMLDFIFLQFIKSIEANASNHCACRTTHQNHPKTHIRVPLALRSSRTIRPVKRQQFMLSRRVVATFILQRASLIAHTYLPPIVFIHMREKENTKTSSKAFSCLGETTQKSQIRAVSRLSGSGRLGVSVSFFGRVVLLRCLAMP